MAIIDMKGAAREKQVAEYWKVVFGEEKLNQRNLNSLYQPSKFFLFHQMLKDKSIQI